MKIYNVFNEIGFKINYCDDNLRIKYVEYLKNRKVKIRLENRNTPLNSK